MKLFPFSIDWTIINIVSSKNCRNEIEKTKKQSNYIILWLKQPYYNIHKKFNRKIFISKPFETHPRFTDTGKIYSLKFTFSPAFSPRGWAWISEFRDCVHFLKRCYRINGSTLHPGADISDPPSDIRVEISDIHRAQTIKHGAHIL